MFPNTAANSLSLHSVQQTQALSAHPLHLHDGGTAHSWRAACISVVIRAIRVGYSLCALLTCSQAGSSSSWTKHLAAGNSPIITVILKFQRQWCDEINGFGPRLPTRTRISVKGEKKKTFKQLLQRVPFGLHYYNLTGLMRSKVEEPPSPLPFPQLHLPAFLERTEGWDASHLFWRRIRVNACVTVFNIVVSSYAEVSPSVLSIRLPFFFF